MFAERSDGSPVRPGGHINFQARQQVSEKDFRLRCTSFIDDSR
ncbi:hypothetical protein BUH_4321 [Burkholderia pseudomallei Pakistan 9]|nr:hypothetical protein BUH_4321 [Burkholderia pseudomallei Pakistan 9]